MGHVNKVLLIGKVEAKPVLCKTKDGGSLTVFCVETGAPGGPVDRHSVQVTGETAEVCCRDLTAGRLVYVEGSLHDGSITASQVHFLGRKA